jgi:hypothetical protein
MKTPESNGETRSDRVGISSAKRNSRRKFLAASTSIAAALAVPDAARAATVAPVGWCASDFRRAMNSEFRAIPLSSPEERVSLLKLTEVSAAPHPHPSLDKAYASENVFSLRFAVGEKGLLQDTYLLSHPTLGEFAALLVPTRSGINLRAEFHRL